MKSSQSQHWENFQEEGWSTYGLLFKVCGYRPELITTPDAPGLTLCVLWSNNSGGLKDGSARILRSWRSLEWQVVQKRAAMDRMESRGRRKSSRSSYSSGSPPYALRRPSSMRWLQHKLPACCMIIMGYKCVFVCVCTCAYACVRAHVLGVCVCSCIPAYMCALVQTCV